MKTLRQVVTTFFLLTAQSCAPELPLLAPREDVPKDTRTLGDGDDEDEPDSAASPNRDAVVISDQGSTDVQSPTTDTVMVVDTPDVPTPTDVPDVFVTPDVVSPPVDVVVDAPLADVPVDRGTPDVWVDAGVDIVDVVVDTPQVDIVDVPVDVPVDRGCPVGTLLCGGVCVDTSTNDSHCGSCGHACGPTMACTAGACVCTTGLTQCPGGCLDTTADVLHCGTTCSPCPPVANGTPTCVRGGCGFDCNAGFVPSGTGCVPCGALGQPACGPTGGTVPACAPTLLACAGTCVDTQVDTSNCGSCGTVCRSGAPCIAGTCVDQRSCRGTGASGCGVRGVASGTFTLGDDSGASFNATPAMGRVTVGPMTVDRYEVTVDRFTVYWNQGHPNAPSSYNYPSGPYSVGGIVVEPGRNVGCNWGLAGRGSHPLNCVTWHTAMAFCVWDGGRLPTEAEWEWVARGPGGNDYPWGSDATPTDELLCWSGTAVLPSTCPVGSFPAGSTTTGVQDMAGGVYEWVADSFQLYSSPQCWAGAGWTNPLCGQLSGGGTYRVIRGGAWNTTAPAYVRAPSRQSAAATLSDRGLGFRCVRTP